LSVPTADDGAVAVVSSLEETQHTELLSVRELLYRMKLPTLDGDGGWKENDGTMREHNSNDTASMMAELPLLFAIIIMLLKIMLCEI